MHQTVTLTCVVLLPARCMLAGYDLNVADYDGRTALHVAASVGAFDCVRFLLEVARVTPEPRDRWGHTPRSEAELFGHTRIGDYLDR